MNEMENLISQHIQVPSSYVINVTAHNVTPEETTNIIEPLQLSKQNVCKTQECTKTDVQQ